MVKDIEITLEQQNELLNVNMTSFREASLLQSIKDSNKWWVNNFLSNAVIQRVDRISPLIYRITYYNEYVDESVSIFDGTPDYLSYAEVDDMPRVIGKIDLPEAPKRIKCVCDTCGDELNDSFGEIGYKVTVLTPVKKELILCAFCACDFYE